MGWQWHQLNHMQIICTLLQTDNLTTNNRGLNLCIPSFTLKQSLYHVLEPMNIDMTPESRYSLIPNCMLPILSLLLVPYQLLFPDPQIQHKFTLMLHI